jgi:ankyrin repeat protein
MPGRENDQREGAECVPNKPRPKHNGTTPLFVAALEGHVAAVRALCEAGADPDAAHAHVGVEGSTALWAAASSGHVEVIHALLEAGAALDKGQVPPVVVAASLNRADAVEALADAGATLHPLSRVPGEAVTAAAGDSPRVLAAPRRTVMMIVEELDLNTKDTRPYGPLRTSTSRKPRY